jgi:hypothetical protein
MDEKTAEAFRSLTPGIFASGLLRCAWNLAKIHNATPSLDQLLDQIPVTVKQLRSLLAQKPTRVTAIASLTGARLPQGVEITGTWGRLRSARREDHPPAFKHLVDQRTTTTTETGDQIEITDAGDIIFETNVRAKFELNADGNGWSIHSLDDLGDLIDRVRLAFTLAVERPARPVIFIMWAKTLLPTGVIDPHPFTDPKFMASRVPTLLGDEEIASWNRWINIITSADISHLKVAMIRTLRAMTERLDAYDRLIDAVIAWESLFGAHTENTLRVSASLARMLHSAGQGREDARVLYGKIYQARSDIVHANPTKTTTTQVEQYAGTAIDVSLKTIACILTTHTDLLPLRSSTRSTRVLLGADDMATAADDLLHEGEDEAERRDED